MHSSTDTPEDSNPDSDHPKPGLALTVLSAPLGICRFDPSEPIPDWVEDGVFLTVSRSADELSIVCEDRLVPPPVRCERGWWAIRVVEPLDFSLIGVLASLAQPLTDASVSIFSISTYDTDYLLVRQKNLLRAIAALEEAGHRFDEESHELAKKTRSKRRRRRRRRKPRNPAETPEATTDGATTDSQDSAPKLTVDTQPIPKLAMPEVREPEPEAEAPAAEIDLDWETALDEEKIELETATGEAGRRRKRRRSRRKDDDAPRRARSRDSEDSISADSNGEHSDSEKPVEEDRRTAAPSRTTSEQEIEIEIEAADDPTEAVEAAPEAPEPQEDAPETTSAASEDVDDFDAEGDAVEADGLYTGAIPQHGVELTDTSFEKLGISKPVLATLEELGFERPTPIQAAVIPDALEGVDMIGLAETGSGKTGAFCLPLVEHLTHGRGIRGLILCPTREIALQTKAFLDVFGRDHELESVVVIGGVKMGPQINGLKRKPDIVVATPGRLADHLRRRNLKLDQIEEVVIDEADHMLDLGFLPQIQEILEQAPKDRRTMMFSATMPPPIERLAQRFMRDPLNVDIRPANQVAEGIEHRLYLVAEDDMKACVLSLLEEIEGSTLIFVRRKLYTEWLARQLHLAGMPVERIHSDRSQAQRVRALRGFREGKKRILVATDVAARGIDIPRIQHVINYGLPEMVEDYVHRAGRTARGDSNGIVSTLGSWRDRIMVRDIERVIGHKLPRCVAEGVEPWKELKQRKTVRRRRLL